MLDLVEMGEKMEVLIAENSMVLGLESQRRFLISCENETLNCVRLLAEAVEEMDSAREGYRNDPDSDAMWSFKRSLDEVVRLKGRLEFHRQNEFQAIEELSRLSSRHVDFMPEFFNAQIYLCNCVTQ